MSKNILDSRNLNKRLKELQSEFNIWKDSLTPEQISSIKKAYGVTKGEEISDEEFYWEWENTVGSDADELKNLIDLREQFGREWIDGITFVKDSHFKEFAEDEADQLGYFQNGDKNDWPYNCIDWSRAADQLRSDYSEVEFDGETYLYRN